MIKLEGVADTLYIPLIARIYVSKRFPEYFFDGKALSLENELMDKINQKKPSEFFQMASAARYYLLDSMTKNFLAKNDKSNVINLGAGLETVYFRLENKRDLFYEVDLPKVIEKRRSLLGESLNEILIGADMFTLDWVKSIDRTLPTLFIVMGVFQYYGEEKIIAFIKDLKNSFPKAEIIFDATNEKGVKFANRYVKKTGNTSAPIHFFINDAAQFAKITETTLIDRCPFFIEARKTIGKRLKLLTRLAMKIVDLSGRAILVWLRF
ncbi:MAG: class I SAM-dependent methyltransferase [Deltaproteobacteria bacterium]|jgi:O-methyltransferase involved in polyketide biosynthesis|nr:class I SAM-dependent methyltransferase [Deltaproteobacteria bacterium]